MNIDDMIDPFSVKVITLFAQQKIIVLNKKEPDFSNRIRIFIFYSFPASLIWTC